MPEGRGFLVLTNEVPASSRLAFPGTIQVWSYGLSTGFWSDPASPAVRSQSALHCPTWFSSSGTSKERCTLVQHGHVFTSDPSSENPPKRDSVVKVLLYSITLYRVMSIWYAVSMQKSQKAKTIRLTEQDKVAIASIREYYGLTSDNEAIRFALSKVLREIQQSPIPKLQ
jgi:hypothetical protein